MNAPDKYEIEGMIGRNCSGVGLFCIVLMVIVMALHLGIDHSEKYPRLAHWLRTDGK